MNINEFKFNEKNPRRITKTRLEKLKKSIEEVKKWMEARPIIIDENNVILAGNQRVRALKEMGYENVPDEWVKRIEGLTDGEKERVMILDNYHHGEWEDVILEDISDKLEKWGIDLIEKLKSEDEEIKNKRKIDNPLMPIVPRFDEKYDTFIFITKTETEKAMMFTLLGRKKVRSYKNRGIGVTHVYWAEELLEKVKK